jgi:hypothetical protein
MFAYTEILKAKMYMVIDKGDQFCIFDFLVVGAMKTGSITLVDSLEMSSDIHFVSNKTASVF